MTNADSRFATMQAMKDEQTFRINNYKDWTVDWSFREGSYYSNKAPGPMLLAFPVYLIFKGTFDLFNPKKSKEPPTSTIRSVINLFSQVIPVFLFSFFILGGISKENESSLEGVFWGGVLFLFGTTASLFFNSFFGHGMAALFSFCMCFFFSRKDYKLTGFFFGLSVLCDYAAAFFIIPLVFSIPPRKLINFIVGGVLPGILWCIYHLSVTGSIFETPNKYINPIFKETDPDALWGAVSLPKLEVVGELLFGLKRGLLITQPWVVLYFLYMTSKIFKRVNHHDSLRKVTYFSFVMIFLLNASFNGWHGGATAGPRYLSVGLAAMSFSFIYDWKNFSNIFKKTFILLIGYTLLFKTLTLMTSALVSEDVNLLSWMFDFLKEKAGFKQYVRAPIFLGLIVLSYFLLKKNEYSDKAPSTSS